MLMADFLDYQKSFPYSPFSDIYIQMFTPRSLWVEIIIFSSFVCLVVTAFDPVFEPGITRARGRLSTNSTVTPSVFLLLFAKKKISLVCKILEHETSC